MDGIQFGWLSVLPPLIAIILALLTKEVISSLLIGIFTGTIIYSSFVSESLISIIINSIKTTFSIMSEKAAENFNILLFLAILGSLVVVITMAGGSKAYGDWASKKLKTKKSAQLATVAFSSMLFIDDYFNCLTAGTVMKPIIDKHNISRARLAYIIDSIAAPICILVPISSWAAAVGSNLKSTGLFESEVSAFIATVPYNLYALLSIFLVIFLCITNKDFGPMKREIENKSMSTIKTTSDSTVHENIKSSENGRVFDLVLPVVALIVFSVFALLESGGYFSGNGLTFGQALGECDSAASLVFGSFCALFVAFILFVPRRLVSFKDFMGGISEGIKSMVSPFIILTLAWTISGVCRDLLNTGDFVGAFVQSSNIPVQIFPAIIFVIAAFLSFAMGTAWGTFTILIPIVAIVMNASAPELITVGLSATLAGSVFGDHCSPISDTTILSSTGSGCEHITHVSTQMTYALSVAFSSFCGYLVAGFTNGNLLLTLLTSITVLVLIVATANLLDKKKAEKAS